MSLEVSQVVQQVTVSAEPVPVIEVSASVIDVVVESALQVIQVAVTEQVVEVAERGARGPAGPPGTGGAGYVHTQASPAATWTINHNLGFRPAVELIDAGGAEFDGEIVHPSLNQTMVYLDEATAGLARLN